MTPALRTTLDMLMCSNFCLTAFKNRSLSKYVVT